MSKRLGQAVDWHNTFTFSFDGKSYPAHSGDTIASALARAGVRVLSRSFKYHRPRGLMCCSGHCPNCLVQVGDEPNVRACRRPVEPDMAVTAQNVWPSLQRDVMALTALADRFLPVGFYYKTFIRPQALWPLYEWGLRRAAGLGQLNPETEPAAYDKQYLHADVAVVGGGPAGISAALGAGRQGARVLLLDENEQLGGHLRFKGDPSEGTRLREQVAKLENVDVHTNTTVLGYYQDNWLAAICGNRLLKIRARSVVVASGVYEQPMVFANNDLPGVMLGSGVQRLLHLYGVAPGTKALVVTANDDGWEVATNLQDAGVTVVALADSRPERSSCAAVEGISLYQSHTIVAAKGRNGVEGALVAPLDEQGRAIVREATHISCDFIAVSAGWVPANGLLYEAGTKIAYDESQAEFVPYALPTGIYAAGRVKGTVSLTEQMAEGELVGRKAAAYANGAAELMESNGRQEAVLEHAQGPAYRQPATLVQTSGSHKWAKGKHFVCFCEDVINKDVEQAIAEGYNSIELLKRYSTISMGPCQGKMCSANTIHLCAQANGWTVAETGTTTARPPTTPVSLGVLGGQQMEPVRVSPVHDWHMEQGARMMVAGLWLRPEHYGDPIAEVCAVRQNVGLIDVSTLGKLRLTGPGVPTLLERLYINRWQKLAPDRVRYGVMCNDEGIVLDDGVTARFGEEDYYMTTTSSGAANIYEWIQWWVQSGWGDGVNVIAISDNYAAFNLAGPRARAVLERLADGDLSPTAFPYMHAREMLVGGVLCRVLRIGFTGELSYEIHCPAGYGRYVWEQLMKAGAEEGIAPFGVEAQRILRLEKSHIIVGQDTDALSNPFAVGLDWAVKMSKPDFLGRRSLQRSQVEGRCQQLSGFTMVTPDVVPAEGLQIVRRRGNGATPDLEIMGHITSSRFSPTLEKAIGLCWLPDDLAERVGATFSIRLEDGRLVEGRVHRGAFYDPNGDRLQM